MKWPWSKTEPEPLWDIDLCFKPQGSMLRAEAVVEGKRVAVWKSSGGGAYLIEVILSGTYPWAQTGRHHYVHPCSNWGENTLRKELHKVIKECLTDTIPECIRI